MSLNLHLKERLVNKVDLIKHMSKACKESYLFSLITNEERVIRQKSNARSKSRNRSRDRSQRKIFKIPSMKKFQNERKLIDNMEPIHTQIDLTSKGFKTPSNNKSIKKELEESTGIFTTTQNYIERDQFEESRQEIMNNKTLSGIEGIKY